MLFIVFSVAAVWIGLCRWRRVRFTFYYSGRMSKFGSFKLDSIKVLCLVIIYIFFLGKVLSGTAQFRLLPLAKLQLSGEKFLYIFQTRFMGGGVYRVCTVQSEVTWWWWWWLVSEDWRAVTGGSYYSDCDPRNL